VNTAALASPGRRFWPVAQPAQADSETLRAPVLATGAPPDSLAAARFARRGVAGLIAWPSAEPVFDAALLGAHRPPWTPHHDPRLDALSDAFALLLDSGRADAAASTATFGDTLIATISDTIKELPR
jgi:hypothetical protein